VLAAAAADDQHPHDDSVWGRNYHFVSGNGAHMTQTSARPLAVVTGASSGIGLELAKQFAQNGFDLLVVAEDEAISSAASDLESMGARVQSTQADLATYDGVEKLVTLIDAAGRPVDAIALNAGVGAGGEFVAGTKLEDELQVIDLNVKSVVHLAKRVLPNMVSRGEGRVLFTSSIASTMPGPYHAVYNASKSFVQSFAEAIRYELKDTGVTVTALMPGVTDTEFFERADMEDTKAGSGSKDDPAQVAEQGFKAMMAGDEKVVAGSVKNKVQAKMGAVTPDSAKAAMAAKLHEPGDGN
jgi:uncharacterized protein